MVLGNLADRRKSVRKIAGNLSTTTAPDSDVDKALGNSDLRVQKGTNKFDWASTDQEWLLVLQCSDYFAAAQTLDELPTKTAADALKAKDLRTEARAILESLNHIDPIQNKDILVSVGVNVTDQLDPLNYTQDPTDEGTGIS